MGRYTACPRPIVIRHPPPVAERNHGREFSATWDTYEEVLSPCDSGFVRLAQRLSDQVLTVMLGLCGRVDDSESGGEGLGYEGGGAFFLPCRAVDEGGLSDCAEELVCGAVEFHGRVDGGG
jgi:hypothetical protein